MISRSAVALAIGLSGCMVKINRMGAMQTSSVTAIAATNPSIGNFQIRHPLESVTTGAYTVLSGSCVSGSTLSVTYGSGASGWSSTTCTPDGTFAIPVAFTGSSGTRSVTVTHAGGTPSDGALTRNVTLSTATGFNTLPGFNGPVLALSRDKNTNRMYVGGTFNAFNRNPVRPVIRLNTDGSLDTTFSASALYGDVRALVHDPVAHRLYVGGWLSDAAGNDLGALIRLLEDGSIDPAFSTGTGFESSPGFGSYVYTLLQDPVTSKIYAGGNFSFFNGTGRICVARLNTNGSIDATFDPGTACGGSAIAFSLAYDTALNKLYVGGTFTDFAGSAARQNIARLNLDGTLDTGFAPTTGASSTVRAVAYDPVSGGAFIGGNFSNFNGTARAGVARVTSAGAVDATFTIGTGAQGGVVSAIEADSGGKLYVGGTFTSFNGAAPAGLVRLAGNGSTDGTFAAGVGVQPNSFNGVQALSLDPGNSHLYIAGSARNFNGNAADALARVSTLGAFDSSYLPVNAGVIGAVNDMALDPATGKVFLAGDFVNVHGVARKNIARLMADGALDTTFNPGTGFDAPVTQILWDPTGQKLYALGTFNNFNGTGRKTLARLNPDGTLDTGFSPGVAFNGSVNQIALDPVTGKVFATGSFTTYNGASVSRLVRITSTGAADGTFVQGTGLDSTGHALAIGRSGSVFVSGVFTHYNGNAATYLAHINADGSFDPAFTAAGGTGFDSSPRRLLYEPVQDRLYLSFASNTASYNGTYVGFATRLLSSGALDSSFAGAIDAFNNEIHRIWNDSTGNVYMSGYVDRYANAYPVNQLLQILPDSKLDTAFMPPVGNNYYFYALAADPVSGNIWVGANNVMVQNVLRSGAVNQLSFADGSFAN